MCPRLKPAHRRPNWRRPCSCQAIHCCMAPRRCLRAPRWRLPRRAVLGHLTMNAVLDYLKQHERRFVECCASTCVSQRSAQQNMSRTCQRLRPAGCKRTASGSGCPRTFTPPRPPRRAAAPLPAFRPAAAFPCVRATNDVQRPSVRPCGKRRRLSHAGRPLACADAARA